MSDANHSVTIMLSKLKGGDEAAAQLIWDKFFARVRGLAKAKLGTIPKRTMDEEDVGNCGEKTWLCCLRIITTERDGYLGWRPSYFSAVPGRSPVRRRSGWI